MNRLTMYAPSLIILLWALLLSCAYPWSRTTDLGQWSFTIVAASSFAAFTYATLKGLHAVGGAPVEYRANVAREVAVAILPSVGALLGVMVLARMAPAEVLPAIVVAAVSAFLCACTWVLLRNTIAGIRGNE